MSDFRLMTEADLPRAMEIIAQARGYLAAQGIDQWQGNYPAEADIREDIRLGQGYVAVVDGIVMGIAAVVVGHEPSYDKVYDGAWTTPEPYAGVHRVAVDASARGKGVANTLMRGAEDVIRAQGVHASRIDTHRENLVMQRMLERNGYTRCGVIYLVGSDEAGDERVALEKHL